jgi:hypothetical protein
VRSTATNEQGGRLSEGAAPRTRVGLLGLVLGLASLFALASSSSASAACGNEALRTGPSAHLPECRAYEQVSPTNKYGANIQHSHDNIYASTNGNAFTFGDANGLPTTGGTSRPTIYDAQRGADGWLTNGLRPPTEQGFVGEINGWSQDLSSSLNTFNGKSGGGLLLGNTVAGTWSTLVGSSPSPLTRVGETNIAEFAAGDPGRAIFESEAAFAPGAIDGVDNVYELNHGTVSTVDRIPTFPATTCNDQSGPACEYPTAGAYAGPYDWVNASYSYAGGALRGYYTSHVLSENGSRFFFTTGGTGRIYMRENDSKTIQVSTSQAAIPDPNGEKPAAWVGATPNDSKVWFLSCQKLTTDSTAVSKAGEEFCGGEEQGQDLYEYNVETGVLTDLTVDHEAGDTRGANVIGFLGASADGSYVYFAANGVLEAGATQGECGSGYISRCNVYVRHNNTTKLVARIGDSDNWLAVRPNGPDDTLSSRVSAGGTLMFSSTAKLGSYENEGQNEIYRYVPGGSPECISCDPSGAAPLGAATLSSDGTTGEATVRMKLIPRNMNAEATRIFFQTPDPLSPEDVNAEGGCANAAAPGGAECQDVYMWEADGAGACASASENGGCLYLISTGTSPTASFFGDASASGNDAFIFTSQQLVPQDKDELVDAYDARVGGGIAAQHPAPELPPCEAEACRTAGTLAPPANGAGTGVFQGPGNPAPKFKQCKKGKVLKKGRCVAKPHKKKHSKHKKSTHKKAGHNGGGSK